MNLLALLHYGEISTEDAYRLFDKTIEEIHTGNGPPDWPDTLEFSRYEASALLHGAGLEDLVKLRYEGWPVSCHRCGLPLDYRLGGWWFEHDASGAPSLRHIECPIVPHY